MDKREGLRRGEKIIFEKIEYEIISEAGRGGSSIVYNAKYRDSLIENGYHYVLIKELFPVSTNHIVRKNNLIVCDEQGRKIYEDVKCSFIEANKIHINLIENKIKGISSYINSFEANGTLYSVYAYNSGCTLLETYKKKSFKFAEMLEVIKELLIAAGNLHKLGILHMDISPDNIVLVKDNTGSSRVFLIDYNNIVKIDDPITHNLGVKEGYSAPEIMIDNRNSIGIATDLFSVSAVFYSLLTGNTLDMSLITTGNIKNALKTAEGFGKDISDVVRDKTIEILIKGLRAMPSRRYQTTDEYIADIDLVISLMDKKHITIASLWEAAKLSLIAENENGIPKHMIMSRMSDGEEVLEIKDLKSRAEKKETVIIYGAGGIGKTTLMKYIATESSQHYSSAKTIYFYVPLKYYTENEIHYIHNRILNFIDFDPIFIEEYSAINQLVRLLDKAGEEKAEIVFLLDGLNEISCGSTLLVNEILRIAEYENVGLIISARSEKDIPERIKKYRTMNVRCLDQNDIYSYLNDFGIPYPANEIIQEYIRYPVMLSFYSEIYNAWFNDPDKNEIGAIMKPEDIIHKYIDSLAVSYITSRNGGDKLRLRIEYITHQLLPEIAYEMKKLKVYRLSESELECAVRRNYRILHKKAFGRCFREYAGKRKIIFENIEDEQEWFFEAIENIAIDGLRIITYSSDKKYSFMHDNMREYLAADCEKNIKNLNAALRIERLFLGGSNEIWRKKSM